MKIMKKMKHMIIAAALMCSAMLLVACGGGEAEYTVTVKDAIGNTYGKEILVEFYDGDEKVGMQVCDENGVATKTLEKGTYTVKIQSSDKNTSYYYEEGLQVTGSKTELEVIIAQILSEETTTLYVGGEEYDAYNVNAGCTKVSLGKADRNYYLFTPTESGKYEFSVVSDADAEIGYYGAPHFVQSVSVAEVEDGKFTVSVSEAMIGTEETAGTTVLVIGVDADKDADATLCINRTGEAEVKLEDLPWDVYETSVELSEYTLPEGTVINDFDITAAGYTLVLNETDGFYHLNTADGPLVVVYLTEDPTNAYVPCFNTILENTGVNKYFFDEDGEFVKKENYTNCLLEYIEYADTTYGVYPLTEDLKYIIQSKDGWWDKDSVDFIFKDAEGNALAGLNTEIAWLFMCGYIQ